LLHPVYTTTPGAPCQALLSPVHEHISRTL
jgi:hypothetical protein